MAEEILAPQTVDESPKIPDVLPVLPLRDVVVYPYVILPLSVSREKSLRAVDTALVENRMILLLSQKQMEMDDPGPEDLYKVGTAALIMRVLKLPDGRVRALVQGLQRVRVEYFTETESQFKAKVEVLSESEIAERNIELDALLRSVKQTLEKAVALGKNLPQEVLVIASNLDSPGRLADLVASNLDLKPPQMQEVLEIANPTQRLKRVNELLMREIDLLEVQQKITMEARGEMDKSQREYYLRQQLKAIQQELGEGSELAEEIQAFRDKMAKLKVPEEPLLEIDRNLKKLERMHPDSSETAVTRTYLEWMTEMPWGTLTEDNLDLKEAKRILDEDHYGLEKIKDRLVEYLAVRKLNPEHKGTILCFVGPPGTGKTSLGKSVARALGRKFNRISLGGVHDESEVRGHRRTYVGAMPGRIIQALHQVKSMNPVIMLDEVDKIGRDMRGDPSAALLEVLDPEQNHTFRDHYMNVPIDLSQVLFLTNANELDPIQPAFRDRMEIIHLSSYTLEEKVGIAERHLIPRQLEKNGITEKQLVFSTKGLQAIITGYTREAGLRQLEREIGTVCRKVARKVAEGDLKTKITLSEKNVHDLLGPVKLLQDERLKAPRVGVVTGLAWTSTGGEVLFVEALKMPGKGALVLTGQLGDVMKESAQAALSYIRSRSDAFEIDPEVFQKNDLHIHFPEGAIPKDGPSAGLAIATVLLSVLKGLPVLNTLAMTGEIDLRGEALPIGGLKEKALAALRVGVREVVIPFANQKDLEEIAPEVRKKLRFHPVKHVEEVFEMALDGWIRPEKRKKPRARK
ncbi:endopeptidase La [Mesoterricola silvestris]|uniref:Lon protease n=1 Tax=Mesoterricola silvestris TaxID=2927979 RepID=A0AA48H041_9BACT|nr:endopeptidase La [Mesoterricola silvestris]BDU75031.1 Lon protease [Mesoterricola silvestris]